MNETYSQPDFYHFSEDSILLAKHVASILKGQSFETLVDIGAGSGIIAIEIARLLNIKKITFIEVQQEFYEHIKYNCDTYLNNVEFEIIKSCSDAKFADIVVANPPYFLEGDGRPGKDLKRHRCRFIAADGFGKFIFELKKFKKDNGHSFFISKKNKIIEELLKIKKIELAVSLEKRSIYKVY